MDIDFALQESPFFNGNTLRRDIPGHDGRLTQVHSIASLNVAVKFSLYYDGFRIDAGLYLAIGTHGKAVALQSDTALDLAIQIEIFAARKLAFNNYRFADLCQTTGGCAHGTRS